VPIQLPATPEASRALASVFHRSPRELRTVPSDKPLLIPFTVAVDTREQSPWAFADLRADSNKRFRPLIIPTARRTLPSGDYSIVGHETDVAVERKSIQDAFGTFGRQRDRFERELARLSETMFYSCVIIEAEWSEIHERPPEFSQLVPKTILRSVIAWQQRYTNVHWFLLPDRRQAEDTCFRVLERWWRDRQEAERAARVAQDGET